VVTEVAPGPIVTGAVNFRDLGGLPTRHGDRLRPGRLFRSDTLQELTPSEAELLHRDLGVICIVDLRGPEESAEEGRGLLGTFPLCHINVPLVDSSFLLDQGPDRPAPATGGPLMQQYFANLESQNLVIAVDLAARMAAYGPTVLHCATGKDRTGMVAALVLGLLEVTEDAVVSDYMATAPNMGKVLDRARRLPRYKPYVDLDDPTIFHCDEETIRGFLRQIRERYGSAEGWALSKGIGTDTIGQLRARLLTTRTGDRS
jgi:protein-tyrosine phosphatase